MKKRSNIQSKGRRKKERREREKIAKIILSIKYLCCCCCLLFAVGCVKKVNVCFFFSTTREIERKHIHGEKENIYFTEINGNYFTLCPTFSFSHCFCVIHQPRIFPGKKKTHLDICFHAASRSIGDSTVIILISMCIILRLTNFVTVVCLLSLRSVTVWNRRRLEGKKKVLCFFFLEKCETFILSRKQFSSFFSVFFFIRKRGKLSSAAKSFASQK